MTFSRKIFISVFASTLVLGTLLMWAAHQYVSRQEEERFISRYSVFTKVLGDTLTRLDRHTEALMKNAASVVSMKDTEQGILSDEVLKGLRSELSMTHIFVVDKNGKFIRSTNENPELIPNAFSFCNGYRDMISGSSKVESTPIVHPNPEPLPYKFLFMPNQSRTRLIEVAVRVDFIAKTLSEALGSDSNLVSMSLFSPHGKSFGRFSSTNVDFKEGNEILPKFFPNVVKDGNSYKFYEKVQSSHPRCCQCDVAKTSIDGEYYYVLESEVSNKGLLAAQAATTNIFFGFAIANIIFALSLGRFFSRKLVKNIESAVARVKKIKTSGSLDDRIGLQGNDEVTYLTDQFDKLLDTLKTSQAKIVESEKIHAKMQLAKEIAHNIKSPIVAAEMTIPLLTQAPEKVLQVLRHSVKEIKVLSQKLALQADSLSPGVLGNTILREQICLSGFVESIVNEKIIEYSASADIAIDFRNQCLQPDIVSVDPIELRALISNVINNAIESYSDGGLVKIECDLQNRKAILVVEDKGTGMSEDVLKCLGVRAVSSKEKWQEKRGLGLMHAYRMMQMWDGMISISSNIGKGTKVVLEFPLCIHAVETAQPPWQ